MEYVNIAWGWYENHKEFVEHLMEGETNRVKPSNEDINHPNLWKSIHWVWFFDNYNMK